MQIMNRFIFILIFLLLNVYFTYTQDLIIFNDNTKLKCEITYIDSAKIEFKYEANGIQFEKVALREYVCTYILSKKTRKKLEKKSIIEPSKPKEKKISFNNELLTYSYKNYYHTTKSYFIYTSIIKSFGFQRIPIARINDENDNPDKLIYLSAGKSIGASIGAGKKLNKGTEAILGYGFQIGFPIDYKNTVNNKSNFNYCTLSGHLKKLIFTSNKADINIGIGLDFNHLNRMRINLTDVHFHAAKNIFNYSPSFGFQTMIEYNVRSVGIGIYFMNNKFKLISATSNGRDIDISNEYLNDIKEISGNGLGIKVTMNLFEK